MKKITFLFSLIIMLSCVMPQHGYSQDLAADSLALVALYNDCNGANWTGFDTWLNGDVSTWEGVTVADVTGSLRVTHVDFRTMTLIGTLPSDLGNLTAMSGKIEIHNQPGLTGTFPAFIWNWVNVERLQIKWCGFTDIDVTGIASMVNLFEINTQGTPFAGEIPVELFELPLMRDMYLEDSKWTSLPAAMPIPTPTALRRFYLNGNEFTDLPDLTGMVWASGAKIKISNNQLTFEDIEPNMWIASDANVDAFTYSPQGIIGDDMYVYENAGAAVTLESGIDGSPATVYTWIKGVDEVVGDTKDFSIAAFDPATESGSYMCLGQNPNVPGLDIYTGTKMLFESALAQDSLALVALYNDCGGASWTGFDTWLSGDVSAWEGVTVADVTGSLRVTHVDFRTMTLTGTLPAELGNLTAMSGKIEIHNQPGLTGTFPSFIWNWVNVERLQIKNCGFTAIDVTGIESMVNLFEINTQGTPFEGEIPVEIFNLPLMRDVYLEDGMWTSLPANMPIPTPTPLRRFYLNGNQFTDLPDLTGMVWADGVKIKIRNNYLTFEDIEPNMWIADVPGLGAYEYSPQELIGDNILVYAQEGEEIILESGIGGSASTVYTWARGVDEVMGDTKDFTIASFDPTADTGTYFCLGQNTEVPGLDILTGTKTVLQNPATLDSLALVALYNNCGGAAWTGFDTWLNGPIANWEDVTVSWVKYNTGADSIMRVTLVNFQNMTLTGTLPTELGDLTAMSGKIELLNQPGLTGTFPSFIWNWVNVERMQIKDCGFTSMDITGIENMVNLFEINTQGTPFEGEIPVEIFNLPLMRDVYLEDGMWTSLPADMPIPTPTPLRRFYLNGNQFTDLPDLTGMVWAEGTKIKVRNNQLTFEDLEPNMWIASDANVSAFEISPQALIADKETITLTEGEALELSISCGGSQNVYTWLKNGEVIEGAVSDVFQIETTVRADSGEYQCFVQNTLVPGLDIATDTFTVVVNATPVNSIDENQTSFRINGNPVHDVLSIDADNLISFVVITDITGRRVYQKQVNTTNVRIDISDLQGGIYMVGLKDDRSEYLLKVIKE